MADLIEWLNLHANLILVLVTMVYAYFTWRMVKEMRRTSQESGEAHLVATLIPMGPTVVKLRIHNTGLGPALNIRADIHLEPRTDANKATWLHPALLANAHEDFRLPGQQFSFDQIVAQNDKLSVSLSWSNLSNISHDAEYVIDLKEQKEGWYEAGLLLQPDEVRVQLHSIKDELSKINQTLSTERNDRITQQLLTESKRLKNQKRKIRRP